MSRYFQIWPGNISRSVVFSETVHMVTVRMGHWLRVLPGLSSKKTLGQRGFLRSRMGSVSGQLLPAPFTSHASLVQDCSAHNSNAYLIPTMSATVRCTGDIADGLMEALMSFGASSVSIEDGTPTDNAEQENFQGPVAWSNEPRKLWNQCELIALFPPGHDVEECLALAFNSVGLKEMLRYKLSEVQHQNWEQQVKDLFQPLKISESLWIIPEWSSPPDLSVTNIILDPGLAFGTGDHPTTQLCLHWLNNVVKGGEEILDYGTGSGILAIAALKLGAAQAVGVDIDPMAISSATHNASLNGYGPDLLRLFNAPSSGNESIPVIDAKYDIVVANLLLNPLLLLSECLLSYTKPGGQLGLSGILESQIDQVREAYGLHLDNINVAIQDGWARLSGTKSFR